MSGGEIPKSKRVAARAAAVVAAAVVIAAAAGAARPAQAGANRWTPLGPAGGGLDTLAVDPRDGQTLYATVRGRVVKSGDGGASWQASSAGIPEGLSVIRLATDPAAPERLYAAVRGGGGHAGIFRSDDAGAHWAATVGDREFYFTAALTVLADGTVLAGTGQKVLRSTDHGVSWTAVAVSSSYVSFHSLAWSPAAPRTVIAACLDFRLRSDDGGQTWRKLHEEAGEFQPFIGALAVAPSARDTVYETGMATYRSRDGGATWQGPFPFGGNRLLVDPRDPETVYGASLRGLFVSRDAGETFHRARRGLLLLGIEETPHYGVSALAAAPEGAILAATSQGLMRSADSGYHWSPAAGDGLRGNPVSFLRLDPHDPAHWVLRSFDDFFATADGGATFTPVAAALRDRRLNALEFDPFVPGRLLAVAWGRREITRFELLESRDAGTTWRQIGSSPPTDTEGLVFVTPRVLLTTQGNTIWRSQDGGGRWNPALRAFCTCDGGVVFRRLVADPSHPATFYALADVFIPHSSLPPRIYRSLDSGRHWSLWADGLRNVALDPHDLSVVYVTQTRTILRTRNQGRSFETLATLPEVDAIAALVADRERSGVLYATTFSTGVWSSTDRGRTWQRLPGLPEGDRVNVLEFAQDPLHPERLLAAPHIGGLWEGEFDLP